VRCSNESLKGRVESILEMAMTTVDSLAMSFTAGPQDIDPANAMMVISGKDTRSDMNGRASDTTPAGDPFVVLQQHEQEEVRTNIHATQTDSDPDPVPTKDGDRDAGDENPGSGDASGSDADAEDEEDSMLAVIG